jgi:hypothetical protein
VSRVDRVVARRQELARPKRKGQKLVPVRDRLTGKVDMVNPGRHSTGNPWWRARFADLVDRRSR